MSEYKYSLCRSTAVLLLASVVFSILFVGCRHEAISNDTDTIHEVVPSKTEIPFYYMTYTTSNGYIEEETAPPDAELQKPYTPYMQTIIRSEEELRTNTVYQKIEIGLFYPETSSISSVMKDRYTDRFFATHDLLFFLIEEPGGSYYHEVDDIKRTGEHTEIRLVCYPPDGSDEACRIRLTLIEVPKGYFSDGTEFPDFVIEGDYEYGTHVADAREAERHHFPGGEMEAVHDDVAVTS